MDFEFLGPLLIQDLVPLSLLSLFMLLVLDIYLWFPPFLCIFYFFLRVRLFWLQMKFRNHFLENNMFGMSGKYFQFDHKFRQNRRKINSVLIFTSNIFHSALSHALDTALSHAHRAWLALIHTPSSKRTIHTSSEEAPSSDPLISQSRSALDAPLSHALDARWVFFFRFSLRSTHEKQSDPLISLDDHPHFFDPPSHHFISHSNPHSSDPLLNP